MKLDLKTKFRRVLIPFVCMAIIIIADQITKVIVSGHANLHDGKFIIPKILEYCYLHNDGVAYGMFSGGRIVFIGVTSVVILLGICVLFSKWCQSSPLFTYAVAFVLGGGIGNLIDRVRLGYVIDFMRFPLSWFPYSFNVADCFVVIGGALLIAYIVFDTFTVKTPVEDKEEKDGE